MSLETSESPPWWMRIIIGRNPKRTLVRLGVLIAATVIALKFLILPIKVTGTSMEPTFMNGKVNLVNRIAYKGSKPQRGDIIAIRWPPEKALILKRVVALPGESVAIREGRVRVNGEFLNEPYVRLHGDRVFLREQTVEPDHYFVIGDNRGVTIYGQVPAWKIVGKVMF